MKTCILSANCQGDLLYKLLTTHPAFSKEWEVKYYINFLRTPIPEGDIENCDLLLYQQLGEMWDGLASDVLLSRVPKKARAISIPNLVSYHLWPTAFYAPDTYNLWFDSYIEDLIAKKLSFSEITYIALRADLSKLYDLPKLMEESLQREYEKDYIGRDEIADFIEQNWREKQLFTTPNHPANELLVFAVNVILKELDLSPLSVQSELGITCDEEFYIPVHPFYLKYYNVKHLNEDTVYPVFGNKLTYKEYLMAYVHARQNEVPLVRYFEDLKK